MTSDKSVRLKISGRIDEFSKLPHIAEAPRDLVLDLQGVSLINSAGVKVWVEWMKLLPDVPIFLENVPPIVIDQCNMVYDFIPKRASFKSFFVPYYSEETDETEYILYKEGADFHYSGSEADVTFREVKSSSSGEVLEMDVMPTKYFKFLKAR